MVARAPVGVDPEGPLPSLRTPKGFTVHLDLPSLGMDWQDRFVVRDEITGQDWTWGEHNYVRLDPFIEPAPVLTARSAPA